MASSRFVRRFCCAFLFIYGATWVRGESDPPHIEKEQWGIMMLQGKRIGFVNTILTRRGDLQKPQWMTETHQQMKMKRLGAEILTIEDCKIIEDDKGLVLSFEKKTQSTGALAVVHGYRVGNELVLLSHGMEQRCAFSTEALGPREFERKMRAEMPLKAGSKWKSQFFMADVPQTPAFISILVNSKESRAVHGTTNELWNTSNEVSLLPGLKITSWMDANYEGLVTRISLPGIGDVEQITTTRDEAMKELESAEFLASTLIIPSQPLKNVSKLTKASFRLSTKGSQPLALWSGGEQVVTRSEPGLTEVTVIMPHYDEATVTWSLPSKGGADWDDYLKPTPYLEIRSPIIQDLAHQAIGGEKNPLRAARKIEAFVRSYIRKKDFNMGFLSAEEIARAREGDCKQHAVLAAALGRAAGLPTRIVTGFGYVPPNYSGKGTENKGMFGFHMWAEAGLEKNQWVAMDAALNGFDVGHIAITKTALQETSPMVDLSVPLFQLLEKLKIDVLSAE